MKKIILIIGVFITSILSSCENKSVMVEGADTVMTVAELKTVRKDTLMYKVIVNSAESVSVYDNNRLIIRSYNDSGSVNTLVLLSLFILILEIICVVQFIAIVQLTK